MLTIGEQNAVHELKQASIRFEKAVKKLIRLEAMKSSSETYTKEDYLKLLDE